MIELINVETKIISDFECAIADLEALNVYYTETSKFIKANKININNKYKTGIEISSILDEIYLRKKDDRATYILEIQEKVLSNNVVLKDIMEINATEDGCITFYLKDKYANDKYNPVIAKKQTNYIAKQEGIFIRSILSNLIIAFEQFFSSQYEIIVLLSPKKYFGEKTVSFCDLLENNLDEVVGKIIKSEVESNMFDSLKTLDKVKDKSCIDVDRFIPIKKEFEEVYYRRNAYVHTNGCANEKYMKNVDDKFLNNILDGEKLICDDLYLERAIKTIYKMICSLHYEILRMNKAGQKSYDTLADLGFDAMKNADYILSEYIYDILRRNNGFEFASKAIYEINYINSLKLQGENVDELIRKLDVSIATDEYKIAKECLLDNNENVYQMLAKTYPKSFCAHMIKEWPIFIKFRESEYYDKFLDEHKDDFNVMLFEQDETGDIVE